MIARLRAWLETPLELAKASGRTLRRHPRLLVFPALSVIAALPVLLSFLTPMLLFTGEDPLQTSFATSLLMSSPLLVFSLLLLQTFLACYFFSAALAFFDVALTHATLRAMRGEEPSVGASLRHAVSRLGSVLAFAAIAMVVSVLLSPLQRPLKAVERFLPFTLGLVWASLVLLVLPVLVQERRTARDAIRRAAQLFREVWGQGLLATASLGLLWLPIAGLGFLLVNRAAADPTRLSIASMLAMSAAVMVLGLGMSIAQSSLNTVYGAALYVYAAEGVVPAEFDAAAAGTIFHVRAREGALDGLTSDAGSAAPARRARGGRGPGSPPERCLIRRRSERSRRGTSSASFPSCDRSSRRSAGSRSTSAPSVRPFA